MLNTLFVQLFEKLKTEKENDSTKTSGCFKFFIDRILEERFQKINIISSRTLTNYYNKYVEKRENKAGEPNSEIKNLISVYLGFENYTHFENSNKKTEELIPKRDKRKLPINKVLFGALALLILSVFYFINEYNNSSLETCIIWKQNHFETSSCTTKNSINNLVYNIDINTFKKIEATKETTYFKEGNPLVWYGKSSTGKMEFFNRRGVHPKTLKELKPITEYIINKYIYINVSDKTLLK